MKEKNRNHELTAIKQLAVIFYKFIRTETSPHLKIEVYFNAFTTVDLKKWLLPFFESFAIALMESIAQTWNSSSIPLQFPRRQLQRQRSLFGRKMNAAQFQSNIHANPTLPPVHIECTDHVPHTGKRC